MQWIRLEKLVCWVDCGRSSGKESYVSHRNSKMGKSNRLYTAEVLDEDTIETISNKQPAEETPMKDKNMTVPKALKGHQLPIDLFTFE